MTIFCIATQGEVVQFKDVHYLSAIPMEVTRVAFRLA